MPIILSRKSGEGGGSGSGVTSLAKQGDTALTGAVTLSEGSGITLTEVGQDIEIAAAGGGLFDAYALLRDQKAQNTPGADSAATTWNIRVINTEVFDPGNIVSIASNQFTPTAGTYFLRAWGNITAGSSIHRLALWNDTAGAFVDYGASLYADNASNGFFCGNAELQTRFTANGTDAYELQHYTQVAITAAFGNPTNVAVEVYAEILLMREA